MQHGHDQAVRDVDSDPDVDIALAFDPAVCPGSIDLGEFRQGNGHGLDYKVVDADLFGVGDRLVEHLPEVNGIVHPDLAGDVKMRRREFALTQPHRHRRLHPGELDHLDGFLGSGRRLRAGRRLRLCGRPGPGCWSCPLLRGGFNVFAGDPSARTGSLNPTQVDAALFREPAGDR